MQALPLNILTVHTKQKLAALRSELSFSNRKFVAYVQISFWALSLELQMLQRMAVIFNHLQQKTSVTVLITGLTTYQVQHHLFLWRRERSEGAWHRLSCFFFPSSIRKLLSFILGKLLLFCLIFAVFPLIPLSLSHFSTESECWDSVCHPR